MTLVTKGVAPWSRPDLGISAADVSVTGRTMAVRVHSLGSVDAPPSRLVLRGPDGKTIASARVPGLKAPLDLLPKTVVVTLSLPRGTTVAGGRLTIETAATTAEITLRNNGVRF